MTSTPGAPNIPDDAVGAFVGVPSLLRAGDPDGPLAGTTVGVKDLFDLAGLVTGAGNPTFAATHAPATRDATAVRRLVDAGADVVGKTITDELAWSLAGSNVHFGAPRNVAAPGRRTGGSSSGSAAAVTAALVDLGLGTDTGGSIRIPASQCGILGWRPTHGAVPMDGVVPLAPSFDTAGLLARDMARAPSGRRRTARPRRDPVHPVGPATDRRGGDVGRGRRRAPRRPGRARRTPRRCGRAARCRSRRRRGRVPHRAVVGGVAVPRSLVRDDRARPGPRHRRRGSVPPRRSPPVTSPKPAPSPTASRRASERRPPAASWSSRPRRPARHLSSSRPPTPTRGVPALDLTCLAGLAGAPVVVAPLLRSEELPVGVAFVGAPGSDLALLDRVAALR